MSNITRLAPYAYMARRSANSNLYDLLLLIPVDATGDTDLSSVTAVKQSGSTRITVNYATNTNAATVPHRLKHLVIDREGTTYLDVEIKGDNLSERSTILTFLDADTAPVSVTNNMQTCAPYLFAKIEVAGNQRYIQPSCIVLFDPGLGSLVETNIFASNTCSTGFTLGSNGGVVTDPSKFVINQHLKAVLTQGQVYTFEAVVNENSSENKPPRRGTRKLIW